MTIDRFDSTRALVQHATSGDVYIIELCSVWEDEQPVGTRIVASVGPIDPADLGVETPYTPISALFDNITAALNLSDVDADWLQAEEDAGRLTYPIGVR
jgi:hypothetical protein